MSSTPGIDSYNFGQPVTLRAEFFDDTNTPADPDAVTLTLKPQFGEDIVIPGAEVIDDAGVGFFSYVFTPPNRGDWSWEWKSTAPFVAVSNGVFHVHQRRV